ncbi:endo-beta-glucanase [Lactifluus subvellereus]|nr:endo-beta-glucanase [Lactifluus subvellereus]
MKLLTSIPLFILLIHPTLAWEYSLVDTYQATNFFSMFQFFTGADPTHGWVNYVSGDVAHNEGLVTVSGENFKIRVDNTTYLNPKGPGRNSVRISSTKQYNTHVSVFNVVHMPQGCGTWPAIWEIGDNWPVGGEIDIVEGVNNQGANVVTMHTAPGCSMPESRAMTGSHVGLNCNAAMNSNAGCGVRISDEKSYGYDFNSNGGGWYAMERTNDSVTVWFWGRNSTSVPEGVANGMDSIITDDWGTPAAHFPSTHCDISSHFGPASIIINIALCGDWAGSDSAYASAGCPGSCIDFVNNNPSAFSDAFFEFSWIKVYQ